MKKALSILVSLLILCIVAPAAQAHLNAVLVTSPIEAPANTDFVLTFTGSGFPPGAQLVLGIIRTTANLYGTVPPDGSFSISVTFNLPVGTYHPYAQATDADSTVTSDQTVLHIR